MNVFGTQMHIVTFMFICIETAIFFYLLLYRLARPRDKSAYLDITLICFLLIYNITGGLLPDPGLPGSYFLQEGIAYGTGFITPCYFPYYVFKAFELHKMRFHVTKGVFAFLIFPYLIFLVIFYVTNNLNTAKNILIVPTLYAVYVIYSVIKSLRYKYADLPDSKMFKEECIIILISLSPWICLPIITYFNARQAVEATTTNTGFLLLFALHLKRNVQLLKDEHRRLIESEAMLLSWNERLQYEVEIRTKELEKIAAAERLIKNCQIYSLTKREVEITCSICSGDTYKQIANELFIAERTVAKHVQNIFEKVEVSNRIELCSKLEKTAGFNQKGFKSNKK